MLFFPCKKYYFKRINGVGSLAEKVEYVILKKEELPWDFGIR